MIIIYKFKSINKEKTKKKRRRKPRNSLLVEEPSKSNKDIEPCDVCLLLENEILRRVSVKSVRE